MIALAIVALITSTPLGAQEKLTTATLPLWQGSEVAAQIDTLNGVVTLPSGGQMARVYSDGRIGVRLVSRPYFSERREGWPAVEIGPASLSFVRDPNGGGIVLLGDAALQLPGAIALDQDGRSVRELDLHFSYDQLRGLALLGLDGALHSVAVRTHPGSIEVVLSAGAEADWVIEALDVEATTSTFDSSGSDGTRPNSSDSDGAATVTKIPAAPLGIVSRIIDAALLKIEAGDLENAADLLGNATATKGTLAWYQMAAMALLGRAEELKAAGEYHACRRVASAATILMEHGLKTAGAAAQPGERAEMFAQLGYVADEHLGARAVARQNFTRALGELPEHAMAKESLARFDEEDRKEEKEDGS